MRALKHEVTAIDAASSANEAINGEAENHQAGRLALYLLSGAEADGGIFALAFMRALPAAFSNHLSTCVR